MKGRCSSSHQVQDAEILQKFDKLIQCKNNNNNKKKKLDTLHCKLTIYDMEAYCIHLKKNLLCFSELTSKFFMRKKIALFFLINELIFHEKQIFALFF